MSTILVRRKACDIKAWLDGHNWKNRSYWPPVAGNVTIFHAIIYQAFNRCIGDKGIPASPGVQHRFFQSGTDLYIFTQILVW